MSSMATTSEFLSIVRKSGLLDEKRFANRFPDESTLPSVPSECAALLIKEKFLTSYQAKQLLMGKFRGFRLDNYKILQPLGRGGMGLVFLGEHIPLKRKVAIKVLVTSKSHDPLALERFRREARASAALDHPNIVRLYDIGQGAGVHFLAMEYVEGTDLQAYIAKNGPLYYLQAVQYISQAAAGLQHAHEKGFVHRDIKPSNLMLTKDGTIKILDMGLTRSFLNEEDNLTERLGDAEDTAGTIDYTSPEQALGTPVDERSDIYSLGATLFTLVTGRPPFSGSCTQKLAQHQSAEPPRMSRLKAIVPQELSEIVAKMMAKKPSDRYQSGADVVDALSPWLPAPTTGNIIKDPGSRTDMTHPGSTINNRNRRTTIDNPKKIENQKYYLVGGSIAGLLLLVGLVLGFTSSTSKPSIENSQTNSSTKFNPSVYNPPANNSDPFAVNMDPVDIRGEVQPVDLTDVATGCTLTILDPQGGVDESSSCKIRFPTWGTKQVLGVPFDLADPTVGQKPNAIVLHSQNTPAHATMPKSVTVPINASVTRFHFLGGVAAFGFPFQADNARNVFGVPRGTVSVIVRLRYENNEIEEFEWKNGEHLLDYHSGASGRMQVPGSRMALTADFNHQIRYLSIDPSKPMKIKEIEFSKGPQDDFTAPVILAITLEKPT